MNNLDGKEEDGEGLSGEEMALRIESQDKLWLVMKSNGSLLRQKSREKWILEGDQNSKYFHMMVNWKRRKNLLKGIRIDGSWVEDPCRVKEEVKKFVLEKFKEESRNRPKLDGVDIKSISLYHNSLFTITFEEEEIVKAILECDRSKSSDGMILTSNSLRLFGIN